MADLGSLYASAQGTILSGANVLGSAIALINPNINCGILENEKDKNATQGFLFHINGEETVTLSADATDHFVEDNTSLHDHIALKPIQITVHGYIGEINNSVENEALKLAKATATGIQSLAPFAPKLASSATRVYNTVEQTYKTAAMVKNTWDSIFPPEGGLQNEQQRAFGQFQTWFNNRQLFHVQTPWAVFSDMMIMNLRAIQGEENKYISDFEITFKQLRISKTISGLEDYINRTSAQKASQVVNGNTTPASDGTSMSDVLTKGF